MSLSCTVSVIIARYCLKAPILTYPTSIWRPRWGDPDGISSMSEGYLVALFGEPRFSPFCRTLTCDRQTDGHKMTAYIALEWRRAVKMGLFVA